MLYLVEFTGPFGFIKPWTAVRDGRTNSQTFLLPSTVEGIRRKLGVKAILRYRLSFEELNWQRERTHARGWDPQPLQQRSVRPRSVTMRGVLVQPRLVLAFGSAEDARLARHQHLCLCRNEDVLLPNGITTECTEADFDHLPGGELLVTAAEEPGAVLFGYDHTQQNRPIYGRLIHTRPVIALDAEDPDLDVY